FHRRLSSPFSCGFFFLVVAPTVVSSLSLHDALPISRAWLRPGAFQHACHCLPAGLAAVHGACRPACRRAAGDAAGTYEALRKATPADPGGRAAAGHLLRRRDGVRRDKGSAAMTDWYYALDGQRHGPVQAAELAGLARSGAIAPQTLVWRDGLAQWSPLSAMAGELGLGNVPPPLPRTPPVAVAPPPPRGRSGCILAVALIGGGLFLVLALGILAAIAVPAYNDYTLRSTAAAAINEARVHQPVVVAFLGEHGRCPTNDDEGFGPATDY